MGANAAYCQPVEGGNSCDENDDDSSGDEDTDNSDVDEASERYNSGPSTDGDNESDHLQEDSKQQTTNHPRENDLGNDLGRALWFREALLLQARRLLHQRGKGHRERNRRSALGTARPNRRHFAYWTAAPTKSQSAVCVVVTAHENGSRPTHAALKIAGQRRRVQATRCETKAEEIYMRPRRVRQRRYQQWLVPKARSNKEKERMQTRGVQQPGTKQRRVFHARSEELQGCKFDGCTKMRHKFLKQGCCGEHSHIVCDLEGCTNKVQKMGMPCLEHKKKRTPCSAEGCTHVAEKRGLCPKPAKLPCKAEGCTNVVRSRGRYAGGMRRLYHTALKGMYEHCTQSTGVC
ncbi:hypothetical protein ACHAWF_007309 [Thalassiosira exigua]